MKLMIGVKAVIVNNNKVLLLREAAYEEGINMGKWDFPGGRIKPDEQIIVGLQREVSEETGLIINPGEVLGVFETFPEIKNQACHIVRVFYRAEAINSNVRLSNEHDLFEWVSLEGLVGREMVSSVEDLIRKVLV